MLKTFSSLIFKNQEIQWTENMENNINTKVFCKLCALEVDKECHENSYNNCVSKAYLIIYVFDFCLDRVSVSRKKWILILMFWLTVLHEEAADETEEVELMELWLLLRVLRGCWLLCSSTCLEARFIFILGIKRIQRSSPNATSKQNPILEGIQVCLVRWQSGLKSPKR